MVNKDYFEPPPLKKISAHATDHSWIAETINNLAKYAIFSPLNFIKNIAA